MTEQELIEMAQNKPWGLVDDVDKSLITGRIIDNLDIYSANLIVYICDGIDERILTKDRILKFLPYDTGIYKIVPENLKNDEDILRVIAERFGRMPHCLFDNKDAIRYVLNYWNNNGNDNTWAVYDIDVGYLIIKTDDEDMPYVVYCYKSNLGEFNPEFFKSLKLDGLSPEDAGMKIANNIIHITERHPFGFVKYI